MTDKTHFAGAARTAAPSARQGDAASPNASSYPGPSSGNGGAPALTAPMAAPVAAPAGKADFAAQLEGIYAAHFAPLVSWLHHAFGAGPPEPEDVAQRAFAKLLTGMAAEGSRPD